MLVAAALCKSTDLDNAAALVIYGPEEDHPERALCRAAFAANADWVSRLPADTGLSVGAELRDAELRDDERAYLIEAAGL